MARGAWDLPLTSDNQHYFFIAERAAAGVPPHVSQFDPKNELSGLLSAAAIRAGDVAGIDEVHATRTLSLVVTALSVALAGWAAWLIGGPLAAHLASVLMLEASGFLYMGSMGCRPKVFLVFFSLAALVAVARRNHAVAGLAGASAFLCWQPGLLLVPVVAAALRFSGGRDRWLRFSAGVTIPIVLYHGYFLAKGALAPMLEQAYRVPAMYSDYAIRPLSASLNWLTHALAAPLGGATPGRLLLACLLSAWLIAASSPRRAVSTMLRRPGLLCCFVLANLTVLFTLVDYQGYPDTFFCLPFLAVLAATVIAGSVKALAERTGLRLGGRATLGAAVVAAVVLAVGARGWSRFPRQFSLADQYRLGREVGKLISYGYTIYAVGCTHLLAFNRVNNYVPYGYFFRRINRFIVDEARRTTGRRVYMPLVDGRLPEVILLSRWFIPWGRTWLERDYQEVTTRDYRRQGISVWMR